MTLTSRARQSTGKSFQRKCQELSSLIGALLLFLFTSPLLELYKVAFNVHGLLPREQLKQNKTASMFMLRCSAASSGLQEELGAGGLVCGEAERLC